VFSGPGNKPDQTCVLPRGLFLFSTAFLASAACDSIIRSLTLVQRMLPASCLTLVLALLLCVIGVTAVPSQADQARRELRRTIKASPADTSPRLELASLLVSQSKVAEAAQVMQAAVHIAPADSKLQSNLATLLANDGRPGEAIERLQDAIAVQPDYAVAHQNLAQLYLQARPPNYPGALKSRRAHASLAPTDPAAALAYGRLLSA
jgi:tetratricopeptide (TPR) repeat protein